MSMDCPKCGVLNYCPCPSCTERRAGKDVVVFVRDTSNDCAEGCGSCGFTMRLEDWDELGWDNYKTSPDVGDDYDPNYIPNLTNLLKNNVAKNIPLPWVSYRDETVIAWELHNG